MLRKGIKGVLLLVGLLCFFRAVSYARDFHKVPDQDYNEILVTAEDGVVLKMHHLSRPGKPIVLLNPGLGAKGMSLEILAHKLYETGDFDVFVSNWRGSVELPHGLWALNPNGPNGLKEVLRYDSSAFLRQIIYRYATKAQLEEGIAVLGHSMGGMMIGGMMTDEARRNEFLPYLKSLTLYQSPHHLKYLMSFMTPVARMGLKLIAELRAGGKNSLDMHSRLLKYSKEQKTNGGISGFLVTHLVETVAMHFTKFAISAAHTGTAAFRRAFFKMAAHEVPLDLLEGFAQAVLSQDQYFRDPNGEILIQPESIRGVPVLLVRSDLDTLAPLKEQKEYFQRIGSDQKVMFTVHEVNHVDSILHTRPEIQFFDDVIGFIRNPRTLLQKQHNQHIIEPNCESVLTRIRMKIRLRGI